MGSYIDFKKITWERIFIDDKDLPKAMELAKQAASSVELINSLYDHEIAESCEEISEADKFIDPVENNGMQTVEIYAPGEKNLMTMVWNNVNGLINNT